MTGQTQTRVSSASLKLDPDEFMKNLIRDLAGTLQDVVGLEEASGFVSMVGQQMGDRINRQYREGLQTPVLSHDEVAEVLVDLKRRIGGGFYIAEDAADRLVYGNTVCPFAEKVIGRPAMCMMTSNVFGAIAADNLGYARVVLEQTIAEGAPGCRVVVHLNPPREGDRAEGREYFKAGV